MILGRVGSQAYEDFTVSNPQDNSLIAGIAPASFTHDLFDPSGASSGQSVTIIELGNGNYRASFTPNAIGDWYLVVYHNTYFPWGKADTIQVFASDFDTITGLVKRVLGLVQENFFIDETAYNNVGLLTTGRTRIYSNESDVGTNNNVIATYRITGVYDAQGLLETYKVVKE